MNQYYDVCDICSRLAMCDAEPTVTVQAVWHRHLSPIQIYTAWCMYVCMNKLPKVAVAEFGTAGSQIRRKFKAIVS